MKSSKSDYNRDHEDRLKIIYSIYPRFNLIKSSYNHAGNGIHKKGNDLESFFFGRVNLTDIR